jgi:hypothetical protein
MRETETTGDVGHSMATISYLLDRLDLEFSRETLAAHDTSCMRLNLRLRSVSGAGAIHPVLAISWWDKWHKWDSRINSGFAASHLVLFDVGQTGHFPALALEAILPAAMCPTLFHNLPGVVGQQNTA